MRAGQPKQQIARRVSLLLAMVLAIAGASSTGASAQSAGSFHRPNLVVLGDSFAAGVGNLDYLPGTENTCKRSNAAYGPTLERWGLVDLQAFVACSGATTEEVWGTGFAGPKQEPQPPQIDSITADIDIVTVGALGNNFHFADISALCILADCSPDKDLVPPGYGDPSGITVGDVLDSLPSAQGALDILYDAISKKLRSGAKVIVVEYAAPFPVAGSYLGPFCPYMSAAELVVAQQFTDGLNTQLRLAAGRQGFRYASTGRSSGGMTCADSCPRSICRDRPPVQAHLPTRTAPCTPTSWARAFTPQLSRSTSTSDSAELGRYCGSAGVLISHRSNDGLHRHTGDRFCRTSAMASRTGIPPSTKALVTTRLDRFRPA